MDRFLFRVGVVALLLAFSGWWTHAPALAAPKKTHTYPPRTLFDTLPDPPFHLYPLLAPPVPPYNLPTPAKIELGKRLFFDPRLSRDTTISCASCHNPALGFSNGQRVAAGIRAQMGRRNPPSLYNVAYRTQLFWDGRTASLEEQVLEPIQNPLEMGEDIGRVAARLNAVPEYVQTFRDVFGTPATADGIAQAIAAFERTLVSNHSAWDRFMAGDETAL